jgi:hypothetical protein
MYRTLKLLNNLVMALPFILSDRSRANATDGLHDLISCKPAAGVKLGDPIDWEVSQARQARAKIVANRDLKPAAGFDYRVNGCNARFGLLAFDVYPSCGVLGRRDASRSQPGYCSAPVRDIP